MLVAFGQGMIVVNGEAIARPAIKAAAVTVRNILNERGEERMTTKERRRENPSRRVAVCD